VKKNVDVMAQRSGWEERRPERGSFEVGMRVTEDIGGD